MSKMRQFVFTSGDEAKTIEALSYKRAVKSFQSNTKQSEVQVEWVSKRGDTVCCTQRLPWGRTKKLGR